MKKLWKIIQKIGEEDVHVEFKIHQQGFAQVIWKATVEVNYTSLFNRKDFDETYMIPAIEERYVMVEYGESPKRAVENITNRLKKAYKRMEKENDGY